MQLRNIAPLQPSKQPQPQPKKSTVLQKVARRILAPIRSIPLPSSPTHSRSPSASSTSSGLRTPQPPTAIVQMVPSGPCSQVPAFSSKKLNRSQPHVPPFNDNCGGVFVFPAPPALPSVAPAAPASPTSTIHRRRGAIVELPNEWYAKAEGYNALGVVRTRSRDGMEAEPIRRVKSFGSFLSPPTGAASLLGGVRRGKSAQAALGGSAPPASTPALVPEREREQDRDVLDWRNSLGLSDDITINFDFEDELDADFDVHQSHDPLNDYDLSLPLHTIVC